LKYDDGGEEGSGGGIVPGGRTLRMPLVCWGEVSWLSDVDELEEDTEPEDSTEPG
jgi:hypothetical protein